MAFPLICLLLAVEIAPSRPEIVYQQPQIASDGRNTGVVFGSKDTIYFAYNDSAPVVVAETPVLSLGNHRGPRVAFTADAIVITAGVGPKGQQYGPNTLRSWRSIDHGKTWTPGPDLSTPGSGGMGFQTIASDGKQKIVASWIGPLNGAPRLFMSHSEDGGKTWSKQEVLSQTVCECCHPTASIAEDGTVRILFRNSVDGSRDFYLATSKNGEPFAFAKLGTGTWKLNACPMDGGGMSEFEGSIVTVWRREGELFLARADGKPEEALAPGKNPSVTLRKDGYYAVWSTPAGIMARTPSKSDAYLLSPSGSFPVLVNHGAVTAAWEENGKIRVERLER